MNGAKELILTNEVFTSFIVEPELNFLHTQRWDQALSYLTLLQSVRFSKLFFLKFYTIGCF